jgi:hypothetical protein
VHHHSGVEAVYVLEGQADDAQLQVMQTFTSPASRVADGRLIP